MTDGVIKGTGNSRFLKGPANAATLYPDFESFRDAWAAGTLPIDLNGINPAGWETVGDKLGKATFLTDSLCTALGLPTTATPTQAMDKLRQLVNTAQTGVNNGVKIQIVSYVGTGKYGASYPCSITFSFPPKLAFWIGFVNDDTYWYDYYDVSSTNHTVVLESLTTSYRPYFGFSLSSSDTTFCKKSEDGKTIYWYESNTKNPDRQLNGANSRYYFYAIG